jgi:hypothetical protein
MQLSNSNASTQSVLRKSALLITFVMLALPSICHAQDQVNQTATLASSIEVVRADTAADRVTIITQTMNLSDKDAAVFWPIYRKYEYERSTLDDRRAAVIKDYALKYPNLNDADAKSMATQMFDCESRLAELKKRYYKKFNAVLPALTVSKFFQVDHRLDVLMDMRVESSIAPLARPAQAEQAPQQAEQEN